MSESGEKDDTKLVSAWLAGDTAAGEALLAMHSPCLVRFFRNKIGNNPDDLVQETMAEAIVSKQRFEGRASFRSFLLSIARHRLFEHYRKRRVEQKYFEFDAVSVADMSPSPSTQLGERGEQRLLLEALRNIPLNLQIVLELHYWEDLSGPEVADALEIPVDTAYSRLRKAKSVLKKKLEILATSREALHSTTDRLELWAGSVRQQLAAGAVDLTDD